MTDENDPRLQRMFDERLLRVLPPPRTPGRRSSSRLVGATLAVLLTGGGFAFAADVDRTAQAAGLACTDVLAKVEIWFESVKNGTMEQQIEFKQRFAALIGQTCNANGEKVPFSNKSVEPANEPLVKPPVNLTPECLAAQERAKAMVAGAQPRTRAEELELKQRINEMVAEPCQPPK